MKYLASVLAIVLVSSPLSVQATPLVSRTESFLESVNYWLKGKGWNVTDETKLKDGLLLCQRLDEGKTEKELDSQFAKSVVRMPENVREALTDYYVTLYMGSTNYLCPQHKRQS